MNVSFIFIFILNLYNMNSILKSPSNSILKSPNSLTSPTNGEVAKKTAKFKTNTLSPSNIPIANNSTITTNTTNTNKRKRKISFSSSMLIKKQKSTVGFKANRKSLPSSLEVMRKSENTKPN